MSLFYPDFVFRRVSEIPLKLLRSRGVSALILDVDNTLTTHNNPRLNEDVRLWLEGMRGGGIKLVLLSNNNDKRLRPFAGQLEMEYTANAMKPLTMGFRRAAAELGLPNRRIAVVGDQIFTDILGGNLFGATTILVEPMQAEGGPFFRLKRRAELAVLRRYRRTRKKHGGKRV